MEVVYRDEYVTYLREEIVHIPNVKLARDYRLAHKRINGAYDHYDTLSRSIAVANINLPARYKNRGTVKTAAVPGLGDKTLKELDIILAFRTSGKKITAKSLESLF